MMKGNLHKKMTFDDGDGKKAHQKLLQRLESVEKAQVQNCPQKDEQADMAYRV